jgi:hypothetical protein
MFNLSDAHHFRKTIAGACMIAAPLFVLVGSVIHPDGSTDEATQLATVAGNLDEWYVAHLVLLVSLALAIPAVLGLMHMLREREAAYGHVGGGLALLGVLAVAGIVAIEMVVWQMGAASADRAEMVALFERVSDSAGIVIPLFLMSVALGLGLVVLALGLYRARAVQWWMAVFVAVGGVLITVAGFVASPVVAIVGGAFLLVGLGSIGRIVLSESDDDWEHTPEYKGFRPLAGMR